MTAFTKIVTERDAVLREREAFTDGARFYHTVRLFGEPGGEVGLAELRAEAAKRYPLPTVTRPRVVADPFGCGISWRVVDGNIEWSGNASLGAEAVWCRYPETTPENFVRVIYPNTKRLELMLDLLAHPTEQVPE